MSGVCWEEPNWFWGWVVSQKRVCMRKCNNWRLSPLPMVQVVCQAPSIIPSVCSTLFQSGWDESTFASVTKGRNYSIPQSGSKHWRDIFYFYCIYSRYAMHLFVLWWLHYIARWWIIVCSLIKNSLVVTNVLDTRAFANGNLSILNSSVCKKTIWRRCGWDNF